MAGIYDTSESRCPSVIVQSGAAVQCSLSADHSGWAHQNTETETLWP